MKTGHLKAVNLFIVCFISTFAFGQSNHKKNANTTIIPYGDNPAIGRYYNVRGIKMYVEEYGKGIAPAYDSWQWRLD